MVNKDAFSLVNHVEGFESLLTNTWKTGEIPAQERCCNNGVVFHMPLNIFGKANYDVEV